MKTARIREWIYGILEKNEPMSVCELLHEINKKSKHGSSASAISNVVGKDKRFEKCGMKKIPYLIDARHSKRKYTAALYRIKEENVNDQT